MKWVGFVKSIILRPANPETGVSEIVCERVRRLQGPDKWAIRKDGYWCLNRAGAWVLEPVPSARDDEYLQQSRFDSLHEAFEFYSGWRDAVVAANEGGG